MNSIVATLVREYAKAQDAGCNLPCPRCGRFHMAVNPTVTRCLKAQIIAPIKVCVDCFQKEKYEKIDLEDWHLVKQYVPESRIEKRNDGKDFRIHETAKRTVDIDLTDISDIMCSALEGGITYWCNRCEVADHGNLDGDEWYASDVIAHGGTLRLHDAEEDRWYLLDMEQFLKGLAYALDDGFGSGWLESHDPYTNKFYIEAGDVDGEGADIIVQYALFGEVVYG